MKRLFLSLTIWRWNPAVAIRRFHSGSPYDSIDFRTAKNIARTLLM
jgi:hypothetical protein